MESNTRTFLFMICAGLIVLGGSGWMLNGILAESQIKREETTKKTTQFNADFQNVQTLDELNERFETQINRETQILETYKKSVYFDFPAWVNQVNERTVRGQKGEYFLKMKSVESDRLRVLCGPECDIDVSPVITTLGFKTGAAPADDAAIIELRRLAIVAKTIDLAAHAKLEQIQADKADKVRSTAYMKILSVEPLKPEYTGAVRLDPNPKFNEDDHNYRNRRFIVRQYPYFMIEYPIKLRMICDINSFRRFLASTRQPNQYLIIRNIRIRSDTIKMSKEGAADHPEELSDKDIPDNVGSEMVYIELSAAGVEFIDGHRHEKDDNDKDVTVPLDLNDYQKGFAPAQKAVPQHGRVKPPPIGI